MWLRLLVTTVLMFAVSASLADEKSNWYLKKSEWHGFDRFDFQIEKRAAYIVAPKKPLPGNPWIWRARFPGYHAEMDIELVRQGMHIGYVDVGGLFGSPKAIKIGDQFYQYVTRFRELSIKPVLEGVSRGGLFVYNWAVKNPACVAAIYCDTPVCDIKSWPGGKGKGIGSPPTWKQCQNAYGFTEEQAIAFQKNPIDHAQDIVAAGIPILHIVSNNDRVVPPEENTLILKQRIESAGGNLELIEVPQGTEKSHGHHFTHPDPERVVAFISRHAKSSTSDESSEIKFAKSDWPWWRGPARNGVAESTKMPVTSWSDDNNIVWETPIPGRSHGSITVLGDRIYVPYAIQSEQVQAIAAFDRKTGQRIELDNGGVVHKDKFIGGLNKKATHASTTIATDGHSLFAGFVNDKAAWLTSLDLDGGHKWRYRISDYKVHQGYGSSPAIYKDLVIVSSDNKLGGAIAALNRMTGEEVWKIQRPKDPNYPSPIIVTAAGTDQLIMTGNNLVTSIDPLTGKKNWEVKGATTECVTSTVTNGDLVYTSGGYPTNHVSAVKADGSGEVVWKNKTRVYVPSMLIRDNYLYAVADAGFAVCWKADTGEQMWRGRIGGTFSASPVMVGDLIYATNEAGETSIFKANPSKFELVSKNKLGDIVFATPTISDGRIFMRIARMKNDQRQESIVCIGSK